MPSRWTVAFLAPLALCVVATQNSWAVEKMDANGERPEATTPSDTRQQRIDEAERLYREGLNLMAAGSASQACPLLETSQKLDPAVGTLYHLADCYEQIGRSDQAYFEFVRVADLCKAAGQIEREQAARARADLLLGRFPGVALDVDADSANLRVTCDGTSVPAAQWGKVMVLEPGQHQFEASAPGYQSWRITIDVVPGTSPIRVKIPQLAPLVTSVSAPVRSKNGSPPYLEPSAPKPPSAPDLRAVGWITGAVGLASLGAAAVLALKAKSESDRSDQYCDGNICHDERGVSLRQDALTHADFSTAFSIFGAIAAGAGATILFALPTSEPAAPDAGGAGAGLVRVQMKGQF